MTTNKSTTLAVQALVAGLFLVHGVPAFAQDRAIPAAGAQADGKHSASEAEATTSDELPIETFVQLQSANVQIATSALAKISENWRDGYSVMMVETIRAMRFRGIAPVIYDTLRKKTGQNFSRDLDEWYHWIWDQEYKPHPEYAEFKAAVYKRIDPRFAEYFDEQPRARIRLDEVRWGGVRRDGIPPLKNPKMLGASAATYLADDNVVFGIEFGGDARAYPKRVLAWHEMFKDTVGGVSLNGVYCTLCGSLIMYETQFDGKHYELGTSGFLYRSNKLMYDHATKSMWSTLKGEPVIGPLVGKGIKLKPRYVVTTTWGEWRKKHPDTTVLSMDTGFKRDYGEGVAYKKYFATDRLMFEVPKLDSRLKNKDEVLALRFGDAHSVKPLAIHSGFLAKTPVYHDAVGDQRFVVLTDGSGANRVYESGELTFVKLTSGGKVLDSDGKQWSVTEQSLSNDEGTVLRRLPAHRVFWFAWFSTHQDTRLVK